MSANGEILLERPAANPQLWLLDPKITFLNHGSYGACPRTVLEAQSKWRELLERQPLQFLARDLEPRLDKAREELARFVNAEPEDLVFVPNATTGVNTILRSLKFQPGDELLVTDHEYNACRNILNFVAGNSGARVVVAEIPFPFEDVDQIVGQILRHVTSRTKIALLDHVTSQTGIVMPLNRLVEELSSRGVDTLVDGAHGPGMVPLDLKKLGAAYYTGNCHKWLCAPRGAALLNVRRDLQQFIRPLAISHGANSLRTDRSRFLLEFGWTGTLDPSGYLSVPEAIRFIGSLLPGGWTEVMQRNRALALAGRKVLCASLRIPEHCPPEFIGSLASIPLPAAAPDACPAPSTNEYPLQNRLRMNHGIEVPIISWPSAPHRVLRISAQLYNSLPQYELLAKALVEELHNEGFRE